jgi:hypothetical protein
MYACESDVSYALTRHTDGGEQLSADDDIVHYTASLTEVVRLLNWPVVTPAILTALEAEVEVLHRLLDNMPPTLWMQNIHTTKHYVEQMRRYGPTADYQMWAFESTFGSLTRLLKNRAVPIQNIMSAWSDKCVVQMLKSNLVAHAQTQEPGAPVPSLPKWRERSDKEVVLPARSTSVALTQSDVLAQIRTWYEQCDMYQGMQSKHTAAKNSADAKMQPGRYISNTYLPVCICFHTYPKSVNVCAIRT